MEFLPDSDEILNTNSAETFSFSDVINRKFLSVFLFFISVHLFWMSTLRVHPFVDLPYHLAESTIYRYYDDPGNQFDRYYSKETHLLPNTFHLRFCASPIFPSVETANRIYFCLYVLLLPFSILLIIRQLNGNPWYSLLAFLLIYNYNVHWGFSGFVFSIPIFFLFFYTLLRSLREDSFFFGILRSVLLLCLFFVHGLTGLFGLLIFFLHTLYQHRRNLPALVKKLLVPIPTFIIAVRWWFLERSPGGQWSPAAIHEYFTGTYLETLSLRATLPFNDNKWLYPEPTGDIVGLLLSMFILIPLVSFLRTRNRKDAPQYLNGSRASIYLLLVGSLVCWFFMPGRIPGQYFIFDRFSVFCLLTLILLTGSESRKLSNGWKTFIVAGCLLHAILWSDYYYQFEKENTHFDASLFPKGNDKTLCGVIYQKRFRGRKIYQHFPLYYIVWKQGISCARFIDMRYVTLIRRKANERLFPRYEENFGRNFNFANEYRIFDYVLVRRPLRMKIPEVVGTFHRVRTDRVWLLYKNQQIR